MSVRNSGVLTSTIGVVALLAATLVVVVFGWIGSIGSLALLLSLIWLWRTDDPSLDDMAETARSRVRLWLAIAICVALDAMLLFSLAWTSPLYMPWLIVLIPLLLLGLPCAVTLMTSPSHPNDHRRAPGESWLRDMSRAAALLFVVAFLLYIFIA